MGRRLEFDRDKALAKATDLFWRRGYLNTSMAQLLKAMKLGEGSFYNTFGSKMALYLECIGYYNQHTMQARMAALESERSVRERIEDFFQVVAEEMATNKNPGCFFSNSLSAELLDNKKFKTFSEESIDGFLKYLSQLVKEGQHSGEIASEVESNVLAKILFTHLHGIHRLSVHKYDPERQKRETEILLSGLLD